MRIEFKCFQWLFRTVRRDSGGGQLGFPSSHRRTVEQIDLFVPQHACQCLPLDHSLIPPWRAGGGSSHRTRPLLGAEIDNLIQSRNGSGGLVVIASARPPSPGADPLIDIMKTGLRADLLGIHAGFPVDNVTVEGVFDIQRRVFRMIPEIRFSLTRCW